MKNQMALYTNDMLLDCSKELYSFDIFETLITRKVAVPNGIFDIMQQYLCNNRAIYNDIPEKVIKDFASFRIKVAKEEGAVCSKTNNPITLNQIYYRLSKVADISFERLVPLIDLEKEVELQNCIGIEDNIKKIVWLHNKQKRVILISDMYLDSKTIRKILKNIHPIFNTLPVYVSSDLNADKKSGKLFKEIQKIEKVPYEHWMHIGNHPVADGEIPNAMGIATDCFMYSPLLSFEQEILKKYCLNSYVQYALGTARNLRLERKNKDIAFNSGCSVGGFILYPYVYWVLNECEKKHITHLYFLARDGYVLQKIANNIINKLHLNISTYYLYVSRRSLYVPAFDGSSDSLKLLLNSSLIDNCHSLDDISTILNMDVTILHSFLPDKLKHGNRFTFWEKRDCLRILYENSCFRKILFEICVSLKNNAIKYLQQEIDVHKGKFAFVDVNAGGMSLLSIKSLMKSFYSETIKGFFFSFNDRLNLRNDPMFDINIYLNHRPRYSVWIELLTRANHGMVIGYKPTGNQIMEPILNLGEEVALKRYGYGNYIEGVTNFSDRMLDSYEFEINDNYSAIIEDYISAFLSNPSTEEFDYFADMPFEIIGLEKRIRPFAPRFNKRELRNMYLCQDIFEQKTWTPIRLLRCGKKELERIVFYEKNREKILSRYNRLWKTETCTNNINKGTPETFIGKRIVLYGAGNYGKIIYGLLSLENRVNIVAWIDKNYEHLKNEGLPVMGTLDILKNVSFDILIIALHDDGSVKRKILEYGVKENKIYDVFI